MGNSLTSAWIVFDEELFESDPATANADHHGRAENSYQAQFLTVAELKNEISSKLAIQTRFWVIFSNVVVSKEEKQLISSKTRWAGDGSYNNPVFRLCFEINF